MRFLAFGAAMTLAAFLAANVVLSLAVAAIAPAVRRRGAALSLRARARLLLALRLLPAAAAGAVAFGLVMPAYLLLEPAQSGERVTWPLALLAAAALAVIADAAARAWRARTATAAIVRDWHAHAAPVAVRDCAIPVYRVVAEQSVFSLAGWRRPRLYVSARVLDALSPEELAAAVAHERAHHAAADNLKRLLVRAAPDLLVLSPTARDLEDEWCAVAETLADERAGSDDGRRRLALAASLVKVARLGPAEASALPLSALHDGGDVRARVERLFGPAARSAPAASGARAAVGVAVLSAAGAALAASTLPAVHAAIETTARLLR